MEVPEKEQRSQGALMGGTGGFYSKLKDGDPFDVLVY